MVARRQVLLVEDEALLAILVTEMLDELAYGVVEASTAKAALEFATTGIGSIDAAVVDLGLPDRHGKDLVADLRALRADLPIVVTTGYDAAQTRAQLAGLPGIAIVRKPFTLDQLRAALESLVPRQG
jgi:DNA-binding response OmpR family regulator